MEDFVAGPRIHFGRKMDNDGRRIDAKFNSNSTWHHSNTLHCRAQGQWQRPHNPPQHLLFILPFLHDCLTPNLARIHRENKKRKNKILTSLFDYM